MLLALLHGELLRLGGWNIVLPGNYDLHTTFYFSRWPLRQRPDMVLAEVSWVWNMTE